MTTTSTAQNVTVELAATGAAIVIAVVTMLFASAGIANFVVPLMLGAEGPGLTRAALAPKTDAINEAGGRAYELTPKQELAQYAATLQRQPIGDLVVTHLLDVAHHDRGADAASATRLGDLGRLGRGLLAAVAVYSLGRSLPGLV